MMACDLLATFRVRTLPEELNVLSRRSALPKFVAAAVSQLDFEVGQVNVEGDGRCGFWVIGLLHYLRTREVPTLGYLRAELKRGLRQCPGVPPETAAALIELPPHELEMAEAALLVRRLSLNFGCVFPSTVNKKRVYHIRTYNYTPINPVWVFVILSHNARHYQLLTVYDRDADVHCASFDEGHARALFRAFRGEYPSGEEEVDACHEVPLLHATTEDFLYLSEDSATDVDE